jgi:hypothetical protein
MVDNNNDIMSEDAMTHGVTVLECEEKYQERYYQYIVRQYFKNRINDYTFKSLTENYVSTSPS